jgi:hypothetical protein
MRLSAGGAETPPIVGLGFSNHEAPSRVLRTAQGPPCASNQLASGNFIRCHADCKSTGGGRRFAIND